MSIPDLPTQIENLGRVLTCGEFADLLGVNRATVWRWYVRGELKGYRLGQKIVRFDCREAARFVRSRAQ